MPRGATLSPEKKAEREAEKRQRFLDNAGRRVQRVIEGFRQLENCSNTATYTYTDQDILKMFAAMSAAYNQCKSSYERKSAPEKATFQF